MKKIIYNLRFLFVLAVIITVTQSCEYVDFDEDNNDPIFFIEGKKNGQDFSFKAGIDGYIMHSQIDDLISYQDSSSPRVIISSLGKDTSCSVITCKESLAFYFFDFDVENTSPLEDIFEIGNISAFGNDEYSLTFDNNSFAQDVITTIDIPEGQINLPPGGSYLYESAFPVFSIDYIKQDIYDVHILYPEIVVYNAEYQTLPFTIEGEGTILKIKIGNSDIPVNSLEWSDGVFGHMREFDLTTLGSENDIVLNYEDQYGNYSTYLFTFNTNFILESFKDYLYVDIKTNNLDYSDSDLMILVEYVDSEGMFYYNCGCLNEFSFEILDVQEYEFDYNGRSVKNLSIEFSAELEDHFTGKIVKLTDCSGNIAVSY